MLARLRTMIGTDSKTDSSLAPEMDAKLANRALDLSMDWGEDFCKPTQPRMAKLYPKLSLAELDAYDALARTVTQFANRLLYDSPHTAMQDFAAVIRQKFSWVTRENISRMYGQGTYFSMK